MVYEFFYLLFTEKSAMQNAQLQDLSTVPSLETAVQCTLLGAYFKPCHYILYNFQKMTL